MIRYSTLLALFLTFIIQPVIFAQNLMKCSVCAKKIEKGASFLKTEDGKIFCSKKCYEKTLPECVICKAKIKGKYFKGSDGKIYCSEDCLARTWKNCNECGKKFPRGVIVSTTEGDKFFCERCALLPRCFCCNIPSSQAEKLNDGRLICRNCLKTAITDEDEAIKLMEEVRKLLWEKLGLKTEHDIEYELVDLQKLESLSPAHQHGGIELGLFNFTLERETITEEGFFTKKEKIVKEIKKFKIYMLSHMSKNKFIEVAAHELAHDWMQEFYPNITDIKIKEGWAQFIAWKVNQLYRNHEANKIIENNNDPIYGDGFRLIRQKAEATPNWLVNLKTYFKEMENK